MGSRPPFLADMFVKEGGGGGQNPWSTKKYYIFGGGTKLKRRYILYSLDEEKCIWKQGYLIFETENFVFLFMMSIFAVFIFSDSWHCQFQNLD